MGGRGSSLLFLFLVVYLVHVAYECFYTLRIEEVEAWLRPIVFVAGLNALGFLVWVISHRWMALLNILIHLVGTLGEVKNAMLAGTTLRAPLIVTHSLMLVVFLVIYARSE